VPEFIDPVFTKTSPKRSFSLNRKRAFWLVFAKTGSIISGTGVFPYFQNLLEAEEDMQKNLISFTFVVLEFLNNPWELGTD
jgi:hypothetical protein